MNMRSLETAKQQWQYAADSMPQLVCLVGADGCVIRANRTLERWGLGEVTAVRGRHLHGVLHAQCTDPECYLRQFLDTATVELASGLRGQCEAWDPVLSRHFSISTHRPIRSPDLLTAAGEFFAVVTIDDVSTLRAAEAKIRHENEELGRQVVQETEKRIRADEIRARLRAILERSPTLVAMADASGALLYLNPAGRVLVGIGADEDISGLTLAMCHAPGARDGLMNEAIPAALAEGMWSGDSVALARDGREIKVSQIIVAHHGRNRGLEGLSVMERDMTDWVRTEEALRVSREELLRLSAQHVTFQESERQRIACDLHDGLGQSLSLIKLSVEEAVRLINSGAIDEGVEALQRLVPRAKDAMGELRRISMDLRPSTLDDLGILPTLSWFFREFEAACRGIKVEREVDVQETDIPAPLKISIYRIVQEAVGNVVKHARADRIRVRLGRAASALQLCIEDNGAGFDLEEAACRGLNRGLGLQSMKERAEVSGGVYGIESAPGRGTRILVSWQTAVAAQGEIPAVRLVPGSNPSATGPLSQVLSWGRSLRANFR